MGQLVRYLDDAGAASAGMLVCSAGLRYERPAPGAPLLRGGERPGAVRYGFSACSLSILVSSFL